MPTRKTPLKRGSTGGGKFSQQALDAFRAYERASLHPDATHDEAVACVFALERVLGLNGLSLWQRFEDPGWLYPEGERPESFELYYQLKQEADLQRR